MKCKVLISALLASTVLAGPAFALDPTTGQSQQQSALTTSFTPTMTISKLTSGLNSAYAPIWTVLNGMGVWTNGSYQALESAIPHTLALPLSYAFANAYVTVADTNSAPLPAFMGESGYTAQLGLQNTSAGGIGLVPANSKQAFFGYDYSGHVGSLTNVFGNPVFRNLLDDGGGNMQLSGLLYGSGGSATPTTPLQIGSPINQNISATPPDANAVNAWTVHNTGTAGAIGHAHDYFSAANDTAFDAGVASRVYFDTTIPSGATSLVVAKYHHYDLVESPKTLLPGGGTGYTEVNFNNRGCDAGFKPSISVGDSFGCNQNSEFNLDVPEVHDSETQLQYGLNVQFGYAGSMSGGTSVRQTNQGTGHASLSGTSLVVADLSPGPTAVVPGVVDVGQAVVGGTAGSTVSSDQLTVTPDVAIVAPLPACAAAGTFPCTYTVTNPNSRTLASGTAVQFGPYSNGRVYCWFCGFPGATAGESGRTFYAGGDMTGTPALAPWGPLQITYIYKHGIDTTQATFVDGNALHFATGQAVALDTAGKVKATSDGTNAIVNAPLKATSFTATQRAWTAWTPTITNVTPGTTPNTFQLVEARYSSGPDGTVRFTFSFQEKTVGNGTGAFYIPLPTSATSSAIASCANLSSGSLMYGNISSGNSAIVTLSNNGGGDPNAAGSYFRCSGTYEGP